MNIPLHSAMYKQIKDKHIISVFTKTVQVICTEDKLA